MKINYQDLQKKINLKFKNLDLLIKSLTHKSFDTKNNNEKIEFLGDRGTPKSHSCAGKVVEVDGKKYKLTEL